MTGQGDGTPRRGVAARSRWLVLVAATCFAACFTIGAHANTTRHARTPANDPQLKSRVAVVVDARTNQVLYRRGPDTPRPIASITKLMTALVVREANQPLDEVLTIGPEDVRATKKSTSRLPVGTKLTRAQYLQLALMASDNRAANVLGRNYPGGRAAFVSAMRREARRIGMTRTHFVEPTGLSSANVSTTTDLARLVRAASQDSLIRRMSTAPELTVNVRGRAMVFRNTDQLVRDPSWDISVSKTGYIQEAGRCLVLEAMLDGRPVVMVLLDSPGTASRFADARRVRRWLGSEPTLQAAALDSQEAVESALAEDATSSGDVQVE